MQMSYCVRDLSSYPHNRSPTPRAVRCAALLLALLTSISSASSAEHNQQMTIQDAFEPTRLMVADTKGTSISVSQDGKRYAAMLIRGDIKSDGVEVEIVSGELSSIQAAKPHTAEIGRASSRERVCQDV